jgi:hypothetical protein
VVRHDGGHGVIVMEGFSMRCVSMLIAIAALVCMGASTAPAAAVKTKPEVKILDQTTTWIVLVKIHYSNGTWDWGYYRWFGLANEINWATIQVLALGTGNGFGYQPESPWALIGSTIEIVGTPRRESGF